jgi:hypothetical protein
VSIRVRGLPGAELIETGLGDLARGVESTAALLVAIGAPRLRQLGIPVPPGPADPEHRLYMLLAREDSDSAHSRYNALIRRLVSFERAASCVSSQTPTARMGKEKGRTKNG